MTETILRARGLAGAGQPAEGAELLEQASAAGDSEASAELGIWLLRGDLIARDLPRARQFLGRAASLGSEDALLMEIALSANGWGGKADWSAALSLLRDGARKFAYLAKELNLVASLDLDEDGYPAGLNQTVMIDPRLGLIRYPAFLSAAECQHIANIALPALQPSVVFNPATGGQVAHPIRTSEGTIVSPTQEDLIFQAIFRRIAKVTQTDVSQGEPLSVLRYASGQQYKPHFDAIAGSPNNRIKTVIMYLNDSYEGGETAFSELEMAVQPKAGDAIAFDSFAADGSVNRLSRHAGLPVSGGTKWVATRWIRAHPFDPWAEGFEQ